MKQSWKEKSSVFPFLENVLDPAEVWDGAPCFRENATQQFIKDFGIDIFYQTQWLENSPDLNLAEHLGVIMKDRVKFKMVQEH